MTASDRLQPGQAQAAHDAIRQGKVPIEAYRDPVTALGRIAIERAARDLELEQARADTLRPKPDTERRGRAKG